MTKSFEQTPTDEISGLPLLIFPDERVLPLLRKQQSNAGRLADWNHVYHPASTVTSLTAGYALRNARKQFVMRSTHNDYHAWWDGPPLPHGKDACFQALVLSAAGYIPPDALNLGSGRPGTVRLTPEQRNRMHRSGEVRVASSSVVQGFLKEYVLAQPVDHVRPSVIDRFLELNAENTSDAREQVYLAHLLLSLVIDRVEEPLDYPYSFGYKAALLHPGVPVRPGDFVRKQILPSRKNVQGIIRELTRKFVAYRDGPEVAGKLGQLAVA